MANNNRDLVKIRPKLIFGATRTMRRTRTQKYRIYSTNNMKSWYKSKNNQLRPNSLKKNIRYSRTTMHYPYWKQSKTLWTPMASTHTHQSNLIQLLKLGQITWSRPQCTTPINFSHPNLSHRGLLVRESLKWPITFRMEEFLLQVIQTNLAQCRLRLQAWEASIRRLIHCIRMFSQINQASSRYLISKIAYLKQNSKGLKMKFFKMSMLTSCFPKERA